MATLDTLIEPGPFRNVALAGISYTTRETTATERWAGINQVFQAKTVAFSNGGQSDIFLEGKTNTQLVAIALAYNNARRSAGAVDVIWACTICPSTGFDVTMESYRVAYNAAIKANPSIIGADHIFDMAAIPESLDPTNLTYYADGTHPTATLAAIWGNAILTAYLANPA